MASAKGLIWKDPAQNEKEVSDFARKTGLPVPLSGLLVSRGVTPEAVDDFLNPTLKAFFPDPSSLRDMDKAVSLVADALLQKRRVAVLADYDVDGATSAAQLIRYFRFFDQELELYVPDRIKEGYGPSPGAFQSLKDKGVDLVITVDCGAAAEDALRHGNSLGLDIVVLDHHLMGEDVPACAALVNPNRLDCTSGQGHLAAAGVVFVLLVGLNRYLRQVNSVSADKLPDLMSFLDLTALGTLCDMAPLKGVNRAFVVQGLKTLSKDLTPGLLALTQVAGRSPPRSVTDLTFGIGPQLNAGGRIGDPWLATKLVASEDLPSALPIAEDLNTLNLARREMEQDILSEARRELKKKLEARPDLPVLVVGGEGWHPGVIGIVAGRLKDEFHRPVCVAGWGEAFGELVKGSARSVPGINIGGAIANAREAGILTSGGGHAMAGGFSLSPDNFDAFENHLIAHLDDTHEFLDEARILEIDLDVLGSALTSQLVDLIERAGPYGASAKKPLLRVREARVEFHREIGKGHLKCTLNDGSAKFGAVSWKSVDTPLGEILHKGRIIDLVGHVSLNSWQGRESIQFEIVDAIAKN